VTTFWTPTDGGEPGDIGVGQDYQIQFYDRGGQRPLFPLNEAVSLKWGRKRDAISSATLNIAYEQVTLQSDQLAHLEPGRHEMAVYRAGVRQWEGPIVGPLTFTDGMLEIDAQDIGYYLYRTVLHNAYSNAFPNITEVTAYAEHVCRTELARKEALGYNLLSYITRHASDGEARTSATQDAYSTTVWNVVDKLAQSSGIDYTVLGRALHLWDTSVPLMGRTPMATQADFQSDLIISVYGSQLATRTFVTDGQGGYGSYQEPDQDLVDYYGEWEMISNPYDQDATTAPTQDELNSQAERNQKGRIPTPVVARVGDNSPINLGGAFTVDNLVPGAWVPLVVDAGIRQFSQWQKIDAVDFSVDQSGEAITMAMSATSGQVNA
jgi:hypothetical protein